MSRRIWLAIALCTLALPLAACGGGNDSDKPAASGAASTGPTPTAAEAVQSLADSITKDLKAKPVMAIPAGGTPTQLTVKDIVPGTGRAAKKGDHLSVQYVGSSWTTGGEFDTSWDDGQPLPLNLGAGQVIPGWDQGLVGMKQGGRRLIVIPPNLAYGAQGQPPKIGPNETLAFAVDLQSVK
jgi:peptidylprolyl isomerase